MDRYGNRMFRNVYNTGSSNIGYTVSLVIAIVLAVIASTIKVINDTMSFAVAITFLYIISHFIMENYIGDRFIGRGSILKPIIGTCSIFLLSWTANVFFNMYFIPKLKKDKDDDRVN